MVKFVHARCVDRFAGRKPRALRPAMAAMIAGLVALAAGCSSADGSFESGQAAIEVPSGESLGPALRSLERQVADAEARSRKLQVKVARFNSKGIYIIVDTGTNRLYLMDGERIVREAIVSTGSGSRLVDIAGKRVWVFNTPRGEFEVQRKIVNPVWTKPDWAFIEDGEPIPKSFSDRLDPDVLGDYALAIGDGYLIHGSIYKRTLGMSVTHGCIRVGDEDLAAVFKASQIGTKVYIN
jgi:lipoprotein-anchoring transpeptidase ErfK/SrfK